MKQKILEILEKICEDKIIYSNPDIELFENDIMDSLDLAELLVEIEENLGIYIAPSQVTREDMSTPNKIIAVVEAGAGK